MQERRCSHFWFALLFVSQPFCLWHFDGPFSQTSSTQSFSLCIDHHGIGKSLMSTVCLYTLVGFIYFLLFRRVVPLVNSTYLDMWLLDKLRPLTLEAQLIEISHGTRLHINTGVYGITLDQATHQLRFCFEKSRTVYQTK